MPNQLASYRGGARFRDPPSDAWAARSAVFRSQIGFWIFAVSLIVVSLFDVYLVIDQTENSDALIRAYTGSEISIDAIINLSSYAISVISFFVCMGAARTAATDLGLGDFRYGWGWTIGTCFIPFVNLLRPWFGFAEIHGSLVQTHRQGLQGTQWRDSGYGMLTAAFASLMILANLGTTAIEEFVVVPTMADFLTIGGDTFDLLAALTPWFYVELLFSLAWQGCAIYYLWTIVEAQQELLKRG